MLASTPAIGRIFRTVSLYKGREFNLNQATHQKQDYVFSNVHIIQNALTEAELELRLIVVILHIILMVEMHLQGRITKDIRVAVT